MFIFVLFCPIAYHKVDRNVEENGGRRKEDDEEDGSKAKSIIVESAPKRDGNFPFFFHFFIDDVNLFLLLKNNVSKTK